MDELLPGDSPRLYGESIAPVQILTDTRDPLPAIVVRRETMRVVDGMHRLRPATARGDREIAVEYFDGRAAEAVFRAVYDNVVHSLPLCVDRVAAVQRVIGSDRADAAVVGRSPPAVGAIRRRTTERNSQSNARIGPGRPGTTTERGRRSYPCEPDHG